jgi:hypothetical protein
MSNWKEAFSSRTDLSEYGDNALGLFALALRFGIEDLETTAADSITDGSDDKKCDIVHVNTDDEYAVIVQCYMSTKDKKSAPANKASDLNTGVGWLLQRQLNELPERIRSAAEELRAGINDGSIKNLYIWYLHNLPESENVNQEMVTVQQTAVSAIEATFPGKKISVTAYEVGTGKLEEWYSESQSPILVNEKIVVNCDGGYQISGPGWKSYSTAIPAQLLYRLFRKYKTKLFSANIRDYLGSRSTDSNINNGIKKTIEDDAENFWVFNNGLTILTNSFTHPKETETKFTINGFSIVNGAQTTGAIGSLKKLPSPNAKVQARFVATTNNDNDLIHQIIQYNNSQNKVEASDFRSTDKIQKRLKEEMINIPDAEYEGGRRGGVSDAIRRRPQMLPSYTVGQALAAFHGEPIMAYNKKTNIWVDDKTYSKFFNENTKAAHVVCAYSLLRAVEAKKKSLIDKSKKSSSLALQEEEQLEYFRKRGSTYLLASAIANCLEVFLDRRVPNFFRISFGNNVSPIDSQKIWDNIISVTVPFCKQLEPALAGGLNNSKEVISSTSTFRSLVLATANANRPIFDTLKNKIVAP